MKRIALMLALILALTPVLVACGNDTVATTASTGTADADEFKYTLDDVAELDYGQKSFGIFGVRGSMPFMIAE